MPPLGVAGEQLNDAGLEVDAEPLVEQQEIAGADRWAVDAETRPESTGREEKADKTRLEEHAVGLITREVACGGYEGQETNEAEEEAEARPGIQEGRDRSEQANPGDGHHEVGAAGDPEERGRVPVADRGGFAGDDG